MTIVSCIILSKEKQIEQKCGQATFFYVLNILQNIV